MQQKAIQYYTPPNSLIYTAFFSDSLIPLVMRTFYVASIVVTLLGGLSRVIIPALPPCSCTCLPTLSLSLSLW